MIELLPKWHLHGNRPSFYDCDSVTLLELASKLHGAMNELITEYNNFVDDVNARITEFMSETNSDQEAFEVAMRQEFQDFIDVINMKYDAQEQRIQDAIDAGIREIESAVDTVIAEQY